MPPVEKYNIYKSCNKPKKVLGGGYYERCLAVHVVKDWLKKDGVK